MITVELMDYCDIPKYGKKFDRVVSVGMIEHVGRGNYEEFFDCVKVVLKQGGIFLLHFISALKEYPGDAWIKKYIFPGGVVPSLREIMYIAGDKRFYTVGLESLRRHYNHTLLYWNKNFQESSSDHKKWQVQIFQYQFHLDHCLCTTFMRLLSNSCGGIL